MPRPPAGAPPSPLTTGLKMLDRTLSRFRPAQLDPMCRRLFQKAPDLLEDLETHLGEYPPNQKAWQTRHFVRKVAKQACEDDGHAPSSMPKKMENYVAFLDLMHVTMEAKEEQRGHWDTFVLQDYDVSVSPSPSI